VLDTQWARLRTDASVPLRRGAWYRVVMLTPTDAVVDVHRRMVSVPRDVLQITPQPPPVWAIVPRPGHAGALPASWGTRYAVCPACRARAPLGPGLVAMRCSACGGEYDVGWGDAYFA
jgi:hypothetical protein